MVGARARAMEHEMLAGDKSHACIHKVAGANWGLLGTANWYCVLALLH